MNILAGSIDMSHVRNALACVNGEHEREHHGGKICVGERINAIAYLAHTMGLTAKHGAALIERIGFYDNLCPHCLPHMEEAMAAGIGQVQCQLAVTPNPAVAPK